MSEPAESRGILTAFGVSMEDLMFRVPPHPGAWKGMLAAEAFILDARQLQAAPGIPAGELPGLAEGIMRLARQDPEA